MSGTPANILTQPGYLYWNPTSLAIPPTGTCLGFTEEGFRFDPNFETRLLTGEEKGITPIGEVFMGYDPKGFVTLKEWSNDSLQRAFPGLTGSGTERYVQMPGSLIPGARMDIDHSGRLLFSPLDRTNNKVALFHKVTIKLEQTASLRMRLQEDTMFTLVIQCFDEDGIASSEPEYLYRSVFLGDDGDASIEVV